MIYGSQRWTEIAEIDKSSTVVVCPLAAVEQHGLHLPLITDTAITSAIAEAVEHALPETVLLMPTMWMGASDHHLDYPGTVSLPNSTYMEVVKSICLSAVSAGFEKILLLNGHGGNVAPGTAAITELASDHDACDDIYVAFASYWMVAQEALQGDQHGMTTPSLSHACEYETSMMLHLHQDLVLMDVARGHSVQTFDEEPGVTVASRFHRRTATGAMGRPELATAEKGESLVGAAVESVAGLVRRMSQWESKPVLGPRIQSDDT